MFSSAKVDWMPPKKILMHQIKFNSPRPPDLLVKECLRRNAFGLVRILENSQYAQQHLCIKAQSLIF